jgi:hypothetical protein
MVTSKNVRNLSRGVVAEDVREADRFVAATVIVQDGELIASINSGSRRELSPGYTCKVEPTPGTWNGEHYDGIQRDIVYNHLAIGPRGWARSGPEVRLHLDSSWGDNVQEELKKRGKTLEDLANHLKVDLFSLTHKLDGWEAPTDVLFDGVAAYLGEPSPKTPKAKLMEFVELKFDGVTYKVAKEDAPHLQRALDGVQARTDSAVAAAASTKKNLDEVQAKLDSATSPATLTKLVGERVALETKARKVLGQEAKLDGLTEKEIQIQVITKTDPEFKFDGRTDEYLAARFDLVDIKTVATQAAVDAGKTGTPKAPEKKEDGVTDPLVKQREENAKAWQAPLSFSK